MNGRVTGVLNGVDLRSADLHTYVVTTDGRAYTAISRVTKIFQGKPRDSHLKSPHLFTGNQCNLNAKGGNALGIPSPLAW